MTCNSLADVKYWESRGFDKIVLSRELSLEEIKHITKNTEAEIETFVHGAALCLLFGTVHYEQHAGRQKRQPRTLRADLPVALYVV